MTTSILLRASAALLTVAATATAMAANARTPGDLYDRIAQSRANAVATAGNDANPTSRAVPGGYARHLIYLGVDARQAIKLARGVGEQPAAPMAVPVQAEVAGYDLYDRIAAGKSSLTMGGMDTATR